MIKPEKGIERLRNGQSLRIAALGDSLTQGWLVSKGYIDWLADILRERYPSSNVTFFNRGIPGNTSEQGARRVGRDVVSMEPDLVFIQFALNDAYTGVSLPEFRENVRSIITEIRKSLDAEILLVTSVPLQNEEENRHAIKFYSVLEALAEEYDLPIARVHVYWQKAVEEGADPDQLYQWDGVHPTEEGYRIMAMAIGSLLE